MEKLTRKEYQSLISLVEEKQESIRKESYTNKEVANEYYNLSFIRIKLETQLKLEY